MNIKVVIRNLFKHPFLNLVKILGLSLALTGIIFISLFLKNELTYDRLNPKTYQIYRLTLTDPDFLGGKHFARIVNAGYLPEIKERLPEVEQYVRLMPVRGGLLKYKERFYNVNQGFECDSTFFEVFEVELISGNKKTVLENPASMVISKSYAETIFGESNPVGEVLTLPAGQYYGEAQNFTVAGIMKDFPSNSHFHPDFITTPVQHEFQYGWSWTYLLLSNGANPENVTREISDFLTERAQVEPEEFETKVYLQKLTDIHLYSNKLREIEANGNIRNIYVLAIAAFILLVIAISNYANLNLGMSGFNAKYLFINKILGSNKVAVVNFFLIEGLLILLATLFLTTLISIPTNTLIFKFYGLKLAQKNLAFILFVVTVFSILSLILGMLPVLKSILTAKKINTSVNFGRGRISRGLIVFQYAFSIALIISVIVISRQTSHALKNGLGARENNIVIFESVHASLQQKFEIFKEELLKYNSIQHVSAMMEPPGGEANDMFPFEMEGFDTEQNEDQFNRIGVFPCDYSFADLFNLQFLSGNNFTASNIDNEGSGEYIINEAAMKRLNYHDPDEIIGKTFKLNFMMSETTGIEIPRGKIIGVVKDFHLSSIKKKVEPLVLFKRDKLWLLNFAVAFQPGMRTAALTDIETVWTSMFPEYPLQYEDVNVMYQKVYKAELLQARLLSVFTIIALFICSMGLFGLALIITQNRVKEIGIRKVNGARVSEILAILNKDFLKWVILAFLIACPAGYFAMDKWLENFAYKTGLSWWIFILAGVIALGIALLTVSLQSWKAATRNPVEALRYE